MQVRPVRHFPLRHSVSRCVRMRIPSVAVAFITSTPGMPEVSAGRGRCNRPGLPFLRSVSVRRRDIQPERFRSRQTRRLRQRARPPSRCWAPAPGKDHVGGRIGSPFFPRVAGVVSRWSICQAVRYILSDRGTDLIFISSPCRCSTLCDPARSCRSSTFCVITYTS